MGLPWPKVAELNDMTGKVLIWIVVVGATLFLFSRFMPPANAPQTIRYSRFLDEVGEGQVDSV